MAVLTDYFPLRGGLDLRTPMLEVTPGRTELMMNFEVAVTGGYSPTVGYERFDGRPSPAESPEDSDERREAIQPVPGEGPVRGVAVFDGKVWAFRDDEHGAAKCYFSTEDGWEEFSTPPRVSGGRYEFVLYNFTGDAEDFALYGVDGVNKPFEIKDGDLTEIDTGMSDIYPEHIAAHKNHLFVSYPGGSVQHSGIGDPHNWDAATGGAGEIAKGDNVTALTSAKGDALVIFSKSSINVLYGSSELDWQSQKLSTQADGAGAIPYSVETLIEPMFLDELGLRSLSTVNAYGNFETGTLSEQVRPVIDDIRKNFVCSLVIRERNQYRILDSKGNCLILTISSEGIMGYGFAKYPFSPSCAHHGYDANGNQLVVMGSEEGYVYRLDKGNSFDGEQIPSYLRLHFHIAKSPTTQKRWRKAVIDITTPQEVKILAQAAFDFGHPDVAVARVTELLDVASTGGVWDVDEWGEFMWDGQHLAEAKTDIIGHGHSMALTLYHLREQDTPPFTLNGIVLHYSPRRLKR